MAIIKDGNQAFGLAQQAIQPFEDPFHIYDLPLQATNFTLTGKRVDLNNGNGEPIGSVTISDREEFTATVKVPTNGVVPLLTLHVGNIYTVNDKKVILTEVAYQESIEDYATYAVTGYVRTNPAHEIYTRTIQNTWQILPNVSITIQSTGREIPFMRRNPFVPDSVYNANPSSIIFDMFGHCDNPEEPIVVELPINVSAGTPFNASGSELSNGVSFVTACCSNTFIKLIISNTATEVDVGLKFGT